MSGPGAIARPVLRGDQCQTSCAHSTRESSMAPNEIMNSNATAERSDQRAKAEEFRCDQGVAVRAL